MALTLNNSAPVFSSALVSKKRPATLVVSAALSVASPPTFANENLNVKVREQLSPCNMKTGVTHSMPQEKVELFKSLEGWAEYNLLTQLKPVEKSWQPQDFLPNSTSDGFYEQVKELKARANELPDDYFVCLVGNMITEEALPTYLSIINTNDGVRDDTASSPSPWAVWARSWTAEENRHGDLLNKYLYLCGRVDMRQVEKTIQYLIGSGMDAGSENNPYKFYVYTSFQERATSIAHGNIARLALNYGEKSLGQMCGIIASDEKRHEGAYAKIIEKLFEVDPDTTMLALADMMEKRITMPGNFMYDGKDRNLFHHFSMVHQRRNLYTIYDYVEMVEFFIGRWKVEKIEHGLSSEGRRARDYICKLPSKLRRVAEKAHETRTKASPPVSFSWIFDKQV